MAYSFEQIFAADPANPSNIAQNASVTIFAPGDGTMTPIAITDPDGQPLANPIPVNANGFGSAFMADIDRVAWQGGGFTGFFTSYEGMKEVAVAAQEAAETAASTAGAEAAAVADAAVATVIADADAAATSAATAATAASDSAEAATNAANLVGSPADAAIATAINGAGTATRGAIHAAAAPVAAARPGNRVVFLGDSITKGADERDIVYRQNSWPVYATITSEQRIHYVRNAGYPGETSTQILARFDAAVTPFAPNLVTIAVGTNDLSGTGQLPTARANITEMVRKVRDIGAVPVLCTLAPGESATPSTRRKETIQLNAWIRDYASKQGLTVIDFYGLLTDPANGNFLASYSSGDGIHPNAAGYAAMGKHAAAILAPILPDWKPTLPQDNIDANNLLGNGLFITDADVNSIPDGWSNQGGVTGQALALVAGTAPVKGNWFQYTLTGSSATSILFRTITGSAVVPGNQYMFTGRIKASGMSGGAGAKAFLRWTATVNRDDVPLQTLVHDIDSGVFHCIVTAPAGATAVQCQLTSPAGTGTIQFAQVGLYDLTVMGVL